MRDFLRCLQSVRTYFPQTATHKYQLREHGGDLLLWATEIIGNGALHNMNSQLPPEFVTVPPKAAPMPPKVVTRCYGTSEGRAGHQTTITARAV